MKDAGFIKLHRQFLVWEWYDDINTSRLFLHCLFKANYIDKNWRGIMIKRGSFITSIANLSIETGLTVKKVRMSLNKLQMTNEVAIKTTSNYSTISITNYNRYQEKDKQGDKQKANEGQAEGKRRATTKEGKKERSKESISILCFDEFWKEYPKRAGNNSKKTALQKYKTILKNGTTETDIIDGVKRYAKFCDAEDKTGTSFVSMAVTWLSQECWEQDWAPSKPNGQGGKTLTPEQWKEILE